MPELPTDRDKIIDLLKMMYLFHDLDGTEAAAAVDYFGTYELGREQVIYRQGTPAKELFIVVTGQVRLTIWNEQAEREELIATLGTGDVFGLEIVDRDADYQLSAASVRSAKVLSIDLDSLIALDEELGGIIERLNYLADSFYLGLHTPLSWKNPGEAVYYIARKHPARLFLRLIAPGLAFLAFIVVFMFLVAAGAAGLQAVWIVSLLILLANLGWIAWVVQDWRNDYSIITNQRVLAQERIVMFYDSRQEAPLNAILAISQETTQLGRILNFGNVVVRTYAGLIVLPEVRNPQEVINLLQAEWNRSKAGISKAERIAQLEKLIGQRLGTFTPEAEEEITQIPAAVVVEPSSLQEFLAKLFHLRFEQGGAIIYRTHWWLLLKSIGGLVLLELAALLLILLRVVGVIQFLSIGGMLAVCFAAMLLVGAVLVYKYMDWRNDYYMVTDESVLDVYRKPLGMEEKRAAPLKTIQSIRFERLGLVGLLMNFGTVYIKVGDTELTFDNVFNPSEVQRELFKRMAERDYKARQAAMAEEEQRLGDWIEAYDNVRQRGRLGQLPPN